MTKEQLRSYQSLKREQQQILHQLEEVEAMLYYPKIQQLTDMPIHHGAGNPMEDLILHHIELQQQYRSKLEELAEQQLAIENAINTLDPTARLLLRYRYLDGLKWEEICVKMSYGWTQIHHIHGEALKKLIAMED